MWNFKKKTSKFGNFQIEEKSVEIKFPIGQDKQADKHADKHAEQIRQKIDNKLKSKSSRNPTEKLRRKSSKNSRQDATVFTTRPLTLFDRFRLYRICTVISRAAANKGRQGLRSRPSTRFSIF